MAYEKKEKSEETKWDVERERALYYAALSDPANRAMYEAALGPDVNLDRWLASCRDAVEANSKLLEPRMRSSLLFAVKKAAQQTLRPDGKQGALIPRWNSDARQILVCWQPMIQGVLQLGRQAGVLKNIVSADFVLAGEPFKHLRGDNPQIIHEWIPDIREKAYALLRVPAKQSNPNGPPDDDCGGPNIEGFWDLIVAAYAIVEAPDGSKTRRAMTRSRLLLLRDFSRSKGGPWNSVWLDEMIIKSALHFTMKHVDTVPKDERLARAFRDALDQDMDADLSNDDDDVIESRVSAAPKLPALSAPNPMDKLSRFEGKPEQREKVPVSAGAADQQQGQQKPTPSSKAPAGPAQPAQDKPVGTPLKTEEPKSEAKTAEQIADDFISGFQKGLIVEVDRSAQSGERAPLIAYLTNASSQKWLGRMKTAFKPRYEKVLKACIHPDVLSAAESMKDGPYKSFYDDLISTATAKGPGEQERPAA